MKKKCESLLQELNLYDDEDGDMTIHEKQSRKSSIKDRNFKIFESNKVTKV